MSGLAPHVIAGALTAADCGRIIALALDGPLSAGGLVGGVANEGIRRAELAWLDEREGAAWVGDRLAAIVAQANREAFGFDIDDLAESPQAARYGAGPRGHFHWHSDIGRSGVAARRKLTVVVQLSDPAGYDGGLLETWGGAEPEAAPRTRGTAIVFPSFLLHRVTPVTRGERWSLTIWAHGPAFR